MTFTPFSAECEYCKRVLNTGEEKLVQLSASNVVSNSWVPVYSTCMVHMCQNCHKNLTTLLGKVKSEGSWGDALEQDKGLAEEVRSLKRRLQFLRLWDESLLSDKPEGEVVTITTKDGEILHAHRTVLVSKSPVFKAMLAEGETKNLQTDMQVKILKPFLHFLYTAEVSEEDLEKYSGHLMATAHKCEVDALKSTCEEYIKKSITQDTAISFLQLAASCNSDAIKLAAMKQIKKDFKSFVSREDYQTWKGSNPVALAEALEALAICSQEEISLGSAETSQIQQRPSSTRPTTTNSSSPTVIPPFSSHPFTTQPPVVVPIPINHPSPSTPSPTSTTSNVFNTQVVQPDSPVPLDGAIKSSPPPFSGSTWPSTATPFQFTPHISTIPTFSAEKKSTAGGFDPNLWKAAPFQSPKPSPKPFTLISAPAYLSNNNNSNSAGHQSVFRSPSGKRSGEEDQRPFGAGDQQVFPPAAGVIRLNSIAFGAGLPQTSQHHQGNYRPFGAGLPQTSQPQQDNHRPFGAGLPQTSQHQQDNHRPFGAGLPQTSQHHVH